jgi:hypothetical protein
MGTGHFAQGAQGARVHGTATMHPSSASTVQWRFSGSFTTHFSSPPQAQTHAFYPPSGPVSGQQYASTYRSPSAWPSWAAQAPPGLDPEAGLLDTIADAFGWDTGTLDTCLRVTRVKAAGTGRAYVVHLGTLSAPLEPAPMLPCYRVEW